MFITTTQAGGSWAVSLWQYLFYIQIPDLHSYETINQFTTRLCKKIYRIYFRMIHSLQIQSLDCIHVNNKFNYVIISVHNKPVHNYSAIHIFLPRKILILPSYIKFDYIWII